MTTKKGDSIKKEMVELFEKHGVENYFILFGGNSDLFVKGHAKDGTPMEGVCVAITGALLGIIDIEE